MSTFRLNHMYSPVFQHENSSKPIGQVEINLHGRPLLVIHPSRETTFFEEIRHLLIQNLSKGICIKPILNPAKKGPKEMLVVNREDDRGHIDYVERAKEILIRHINMQLPSDHSAFQGNIRIVWFCKTLQNWKAIATTDLPDNALYEITHNGDKNQTYVDTYEKKSNYVFDGS